MEIEQKERERIEAKYPTERQGLEVKTMFHWMDVQLSRQGSAMEEHLHLQKEVIQPLRDEIANWKSLSELNYQESLSKGKTIYKLEAENKALMEALKNMREWLSHDASESENKNFLDDIAMVDQLLTKNEG